MYSLEGITENICGFKGENVTIEDSSIKSEEMSGLAVILGKSFEDDVNNINKGYPILSRQ